MAFLDTFFESSRGQALRQSRLGARIHGMNGRDRALVALALVLLVSGSVALTVWGAREDYVLLARDLPYGEAAEMRDQLGREGVRIREGGAGREIWVRESAYAAARVALTRGGLDLEGRTAPEGLEIFSRPAWGMTDFAESVNFRRALEGSLAGTVQDMDWVHQARVHIQIPERAPFRRTQEPSSAVVTVGLRSNAPPTSEAVQAVRLLVSSAVPRLTTDRVTVLDTRGRVLSSPTPDSPGALQEYRVMVRREIEHEMALKLQGLLGDLYGSENFRVEVSAALDFDRFQRTEHRYDPDRQTILSEQRREALPMFDGLDVGGGGSSVTTNFQNTYALEAFERAQGRLERLSVAVVVNDRIFGAVEVGTDPVGGGSAEGPVDLASGFDPTTADGREALRELVHAAIGGDGERGDQVVITAAPFRAPPPVQAEDHGFVEWLSQNPRHAVALFGILSLLLATLTLLWVLRPKREEAFDDEVEEAEDEGEDEDDSAEERTAESIRRSLEEESSEEEESFLMQLEMAREQAGTDPDATFRMVQALIEEDG